MSGVFETIFNTPSPPGKTLWCLDESSMPLLSSLSAKTNTTVLTNRYDIHQAALRAGLNSSFNDWQLPDAPLHQHIVLPTMKEKAVMHHLINQAAQNLPLNGVLSIAGEKNQGAKNYIDKAAKLFKSRSKAKKRGLVYTTQLEKTENVLDDIAWLDTQDYTQHRSVEDAGIRFISKPGVFGWDKVDQGSQLLIDCFGKAFKSANQHDGATLLDLGCGWGFLLTQTAHLPFAKRVATDNNAAALACVEANAKASNLEVEIVASDAGDTLATPVDIILCNPPFHAGFDHTNNLTHKFVHSAARLLLAKQGMAYFVVNSFIGLEKIASTVFAKVDTLANNGQFKVLKLSY